MFDSQANRILLISAATNPGVKSNDGICGWLSGQGYKVVCHTDLQESQSLAMESRFSAVVFGHGLEAREIREMIHWIRGKGIPVLVVHEGECPPGVFATAFLRHPCGPEELLRMIGWLVWH